MTSRVGRKSPYLKTTISEGFKNFQSFAEWCNDQFNFNYTDENGDVFQLDKDLLGGDRDNYSSVTCLFLPRRINTFIRGERVKNRGASVGICIRKRKSPYEVNSYGLEGEKIYLGSFKLLEEAEEVYSNHKRKIAVEYATKYETVITKEAYTSLLNFKIKKVEGLYEFVR